MKIKDMFYKDINREIKGVIKIGQDDDSNIFQELDEYVVTRELSKHFSDFFESYKKGIVYHTDKMGVWISGFFGSGKSHFLKILSYLLENKEVKGKKSIQYFNDKIIDPVVLSDMKLAGDTSCDVILFNIDSKSESDSKLSKDAIVKVFMRVFNDMLGYCGSIPWVADLERQMDIDGTYTEFKKTFEELSGKPWIEAREDIFYEEDAIVEALSKATKMSADAARDWYNKAEQNYTLSVEKFARRVKEYIQSKDKNHHVVFLVDEIGQYIGDNSQLMLNLQTVVEDLGTECSGRAWVIVTSQQDIDSVTKVKGNDFSKIQGRFDTRLSLSSANVDEVIKKRILLKNDVAKDTLKLLYDNKSAIIKNLITFSADTPEKKVYDNAEEFVDVYPFVPYQFNLMQQTLTSIREHGASGKHLAEGERSMLSSFQESAMKYENELDGALIPFSTFYDTIEAFLDSNIRTVIIHAQDNKRLNDFDVELLKVMFLIKYVKEIPSNIENLATLMIKNIDEDKIDLKKKIEESLKKLIKETLVQKNGDEYTFLTNEEQDINKEIKNVKVDMSEIIQKVSEVIFEEIYSNKKYSYNSMYNFSFNQVVDDRNFRGNQGNEIGLKIITPYYDSNVEMSREELKMMSSIENNLIIHLPNDTSFLDEMEEALKIQNYLLQKGGSKSTDTIEEIKARKINEVQERKGRVKDLLIESIKHADIYVNGQKLDIREKSPVERMDDGFKVLIESLYTKLNYITKFIDSQKDIYDILSENTIQTSVIDVTPNKLALDEMDSYIERNTLRHISITMKTLLNFFVKAPYGWREIDIEGLAARLFKLQEIKLQINSEYLDDDDRETVKYITKRDYLDRLLVEKRIKVPVFQLNNARDLSQKLFNISALPTDEDGMMRRLKELIRNEIEKLKELLIYYETTRYPGKNVLEDGKKLLDEVYNIKDSMEFFEVLDKYKDDLLDYAEDSFEVKKFFENQRVYFDKAVNVINIYKKNKTYVIDKNAIDIANQIDKILSSARPYSDIPKLPDLVERFRVRFMELLEEECKPVRVVIENDRQIVLKELSMYDFKDEYYESFNNRFTDLLYRLDHSNNFYEAIAMKEESDRIKLRILNEIQNIIRVRKPKVPVEPGRIIDPPKVPYTVKTTKNISISNILHGAKTIENEKDIDDLLYEIKQRLKTELNKDTIIKLV